MKINIPRGFPAGGTLKCMESKDNTGLEDVKSIFIIFVNRHNNIYIH